ncbi:uncharacterized protein [Drosophila kikkawai]|uniref:Uncharacterized protein n=1 Tax=Drosophila kikkawai TaxID=30033 RepID=A0A6P4INU6_DROKI|nr:uncharacterized protein LOC108080068 [Drosophila kikkawai]
MKLLLLVCLILAALLLGDARPSEVDSPEPDANELDNGEEAVAKPPGIVSIKVRHVQADPLLCQQLSRYHPHHPQCHGYCKRQGHWIGQCKKNSCHCFS